MLDRLQLPLAVGHADVAADMAFHMSMDYFQTGNPGDYWKDVRTFHQVTEPLTLTDRSFVIVEGDVLADITVPGGTLVVYGNLQSTIDAREQTEVVLAGDVLAGATVSADGILHLFVGGNLAGSLKARGSCRAWVQGDLSGQVWTGNPVTQLRVLGDWTAAIRPSDKPALLYLEVVGYMPYKALEQAAAVGYTEFNASVGKSDRPAGLYPDRDVYRALRQHRSYNRWTIRG